MGFPKIHTVFLWMFIISMAFYAFGFPLNTEIDEPSVLTVQEEDAEQTQKNTLSLDHVLTIASNASIYLIPVSFSIDAVELVFIEPDYPVLNKRKAISGFFSLIFHKSIAPQAP
jgi:hypothetical protein